ncbi:MAG: UDP-N-acetyl-D-glucosamine dehydrogenase [Acidobacteria bacterium]|nr:UDP-N-acetyl-D-glucosamine dehydrogenase [Acidobacteriota bacterium]|tara:strand:+ start:2968 stop:4278 length:1311 start_codon:yes stop_codon:yes gene_type:complete
MSDARTLLLQRLRGRSATVGVIGLGYVGLPLLVEFAKAGFSTIGFDVDHARVERIGRGESDIPDVATEELVAAVEAGRLLATTDVRRLTEVDTVNICVPTPLRKTKDPDLSFVAAATESVGAHLQAGQLIILESTTYPGTTEEVVQPRLERGGLKVGRDFFLAFSPERVDPGNAEWRTANIPKVVGGIDPASTELAAALYQQIVDTVVPVSSTRVAEMVKLLENTFRAVNIGLVNELALMCRDLGVNVWEVIDAAKTKPFGFMPFYPGPGLGGHCIPIDPFYLSWKARQNGFESRFIELAGHINGRMPRYVLERISDALNTVGKPLKGSTIHLFGIAYKANVGDTRESPAIDLAQLLRARGASLSYSDPYAAVLELGPSHLDAIEPATAFDQGFDCAVITTSHSLFDYDEIVRRSPLIVDTRNALRGRTESHIVRL